MVWLPRHETTGMATNPIKIKTRTFAAILALVIAIEALVGWALNRADLPLYGGLGIVRIFQALAIVAVVVWLEADLGAIGWAFGDWAAGLKWGALWSLGFGLIAAIGMFIIHLTGKNPFHLLQFRLPAKPADLAMLFIVGGLVGPLAEELCFRGVLYTYFRRWGILIAMVASTTIFVSLHFNALPVTQVVGGIIFALAYEIHRNLMVPISIHVLGNLALFVLSLPVFH